MASEVATPVSCRREESEGGSLEGWSPPSAESSFDGSSSGCKLFLFNLARSVTDASLAPLFAPFSPLYCCVAIGKKGTSRRFGFAKFADQGTAQAALDALRGTQLHGKELDIKIAVALEDPVTLADPSGASPALNATLQPQQPLQAGPAVRQDLSPRIAAARPSQQLPAASAAAHSSPQQPLPMPLPLPLLPGGGPPAAPAAPAAAPTKPAVPAQLPADQPPPPMQHLLVVQHGPGLLHDSIMQLCWCFRPHNISTASDGSGGHQSSMLFSTLQQAHAAQEMLAQRAAQGFPPAITSIVSIPLHGAPPGMPGPLFAAAPPPMPQQQAAPQFQPGMEGAPPAPMQQVAPQGPLPMGRPPLPPGIKQQPAPAAQPQREAIGATMRPLYAAPGRPGHVRPVIMPPVYPWPAHGQPMHRPPPASRPPAVLPAPPPFHYLASQPPPPQLQPAPAAPMPSLPDSLNCDGPNSPKAQGKLNPGAVEFSPTKPGRAAAAAAAVAAAGAARPAAQPAAVSGGPSVLLPPVIQSIYGSIEAALAGRSFVPAWDRMVQQHAMGPGQPLVVAETVECDSGTEDEGECQPPPQDIFAAVSAFNLNMVFITRTAMRRLAPVEVLLKQTAVGDNPAAAPSVLAGAVVRVLIDKAYKLRQVQSTYVKPETGRLMLVLHDVSSPIPADHISNTNPLAAAASSQPGGSGVGQLPPPAEAELLEFQARLAYHGRRLFRFEVAATAWRLQFSGHWQREAGAGKTGDELRLAAAHLRGMLEDEDEIRWRRRGVHGLDLAQETAMIAQTFHLSWAAAANWMAQSSPGAKLEQMAFPGGSPSSAERSNITGDYATREPLSQHEVGTAALLRVMGLQRSERLLPCRAARRSLLRAVADPALHDQFMASVYAGHHPSGTPPLPGGGSEEGTASQAPSQAGDLLVASTQLQEGEEGIDEVADDEEEAGGWAVAAEDSESQLLLEASSFGADGPELPEFFAPALTLGSAHLPTAAKPSGSGGNENSNPHPAGAAAAAKEAAAGILVAALERAGSGRITAVRAKQ